MNPVFNALDYGPAAPTGRFLYVEKDKLPELALQYYLLSSDPAAVAKDQRTALPIVSIPFSGTSRILSLPVEPIIAYPNGSVAGEMKGYVQRSILRIYDFGGDGTGEVTVERFVSGLFGRSGSLGKTSVKLNRRGGDDATFPWFGELEELNSCLPFSQHTPCMAFTLRLEIVPVTPGMKYWAFVSTTHNQTHQVTVFAPQPR